MIYVALVDMSNFLHKEIGQVWENNLYSNALKYNDKNNNHLERTRLYVQSSHIVSSHSI